MRLDIASHKGGEEKPAVVFIHGLGMNKDIWVNPIDSRILGGQFPLKVLLRRMFSEEESVFQTTYDDLRRRDYSVITWSQGRPAGPINLVVPELDEVVEIAEGMTKTGIILIGHSRGGLIGRKYLQEKDRRVKGLITISTPHNGSSIARISKYLSPLFSTLYPLIPDGNRGTLSFSIKRVFDFLRSKALKELLPESNFFKSLRDGARRGTYYASVGGTNPTLFTFHDFSFPDMFEKIIPGNIYPEEMKKGMGDGLVSAASSEIPWGDRHLNFDRNHAEILFDKDARAALVRIVEEISY